MAHIRKLHGIILVYFLYGFSVYAQQPELQKIDRKDLSKYIRDLSSSEFEGRATGTEGAKKTANYIAQKFKELQLLPIQNDNYFQSFTLTRRYIGESSIQTKRHKLTHFTEYVTTANTDIPVEVEKTVVFGGNGTPEELDKIDVAGKMVLVFYSSFRNTMRLNDELQKRDAFGFMVALPDDDARFEQHIRSNSHLKQIKIVNRNSRLFSFNFLSDRAFLPEFAVSNKAVSSIMKMSVEALKKTIAAGEIQKAPAQNVRIVHRKITEDFEENNVVGYLRGTTSRAIVISAHYDHMGKRDNIYYPGADDNASGIAAVLELAEMFANRKDLPYSLVFLAAAAEENGLLGSDYFVENPIPGLTDSIVLNINIDMIGRDDFATAADPKNRFYFTAKEVDADVVDIFKKADNLFPNCDMIYQSPHVEPYFNYSDQFNFYAKGIPAIALFSGKHDDYHRTTDTHDKIDYSKLTERVQLIAKAIELLQNEYSGYD